MFKFLVILAILAVLAGVGYYVFFYNPSRPNVTLAISVPDQVMVGEPFEVTLDYTNHSPNTLQNANIYLTLPDNVSILGQSEDIKVDQIPLDNLAAGASGQEKVQLIVLSDPQTVKRLSGKISYSLPNTQASYEADAVADVIVGQPAANLQFTAPDSVVSGQNFTIDLHYKNNSGQDFPGAIIHMDYPPIFTVSQSDPQPSAGKNEWSLGNLAANAEGDIKIQGSAVGQDGTALNFTVRFLSKVNGQSYELQRQVAGVNIAQSPLSLALQANGSANYIAKIGDSIHYTINYANNSQTALKSANIKVSLSGGLFDFSTMRTDGVLNSVTDTLTWSAANYQALQNIAPGASGQVAFDINLLSAFPVKRLGDKNFALKVQAEMDSPTVPTGIQAAETVSAASLTVNVQDKMDLSAVAYYYEPTAGIKNTGPYPPKANQPTTYTVHWKITNWANDISGVKVTAFLQSGTSFTGQVKSNLGAAPQYDSRTGQVTWQIPSVPAGAGILTPAPEAVFQVQNTPSVNQVGQQNIVFLSNAELTALDTFTNINLDETVPALDTGLPYDTRISVNDRRVTN